MNDGFFAAILHERAVYELGAIVPEETHAHLGCAKGAEGPFDAHFVTTRDAYRRDGKYRFSVAKDHEIYGVYCALGTRYLRAEAIACAAKICAIASEWCSVFAHQGECDSTTFGPPFACHVGIVGLLSAHDNEQERRGGDGA